MVLDRSPLDNVDKSPNFLSKKEEGPIRLFCFPFAGGSSRLYVDWKDHEQLSSVVEIQDFEIPGRMMRIEEVPIKDAHALASQVIQEIEETESSNASPIVLFGHSFGGIVAFEVARRLEDLGKAPLAVFVSAAAPPHLPLTTTCISNMDAESIVKYFASRGYQVPREILNDKESLELFLRTAKADYTVLETYQPSYEKIKSPLYVLGGDEDPGIPKENLSEWEKHAEGSFSCHVYKKQGHYYLYDSDTFTDMGDRIAQAVRELDPTFKAQLEREEKLKGIVADAFRKALSLDSSLLITESSNFFELGGSSLDTMVLTTLFKKMLDMHVTQNEFMMHPSVGMLAKRILELQQSFSSGVPVLEDVEPCIGEWFPASPGQEQMVSCWATAPAMYNMPTTIEFQGKLDVGVLRDAFCAVVDRQPMLRTIVKIDNSMNKILQKVLENSEECFELLEMTVDDLEAARVLIEKASVRHFDLTKPPVLRGLLVHTPKSHLLLLNQHHVGSVSTSGIAWLVFLQFTHLLTLGVSDAILSDFDTIQDGWSRTQLRIQLLQTYLALQKDEPLPPIQLHPNYVDWTMWNRRWLHDYGQKEKQTDYWKQKLSNLSALDLPLDFPRPSVLSVKGTRIGVAIGADLTQQFMALMAKQHVNPFVGLLSLYMVLLNRWGGGEDFAVGIALANRHHDGIGDRIGYFANEVAVRAEMAKSPTYSDVLQRIRKNVMEGMANAG